MTPQAMKCASKVVLLICCVVVLNFEASPQQRRSQATRAPRVDYSRFSHRTEQHRAACSSCHTFPSKNWKEARKTDAFPDITEYPEHKSCLACHRQQFFARERPAPSICSNCHVKVTPNDTARFPFPSLGESFLSTVKGRDFVSDFRVAFPHDKHTDSGCVDCHKAAKPEDKSFQTRLLTHTECFVCHNQESEVAPLPPNCDACHKPATK
jgi:hypothetical protein